MDVAFPVTVLEHLTNGLAQFVKENITGSSRRRVEMKGVLVVPRISVSDKLRALEVSQPSKIETNPYILLHPNIPKPMHGMAPRVVLGQSWWNKERKLAYASLDFHCEACGVHKTEAKYKQWLEGHEVYQINYPLGRMVYVRTAPLCHYCHSYIHRGRLEWLLQTRMINYQKFAAIIQHGDRVLGASKLSPKIDYVGPIADWENWRLVVNGKEYLPKFKNEAEWLANNQKGTE